MTTTTTPTSAGHLWQRAWTDAWASFTAPALVAAGRALHTNGALRQIQIEPGAATATVTTSGGSREYHPHITVATLERRSWDRVHRAVAAEPALGEAIAAGRFPSELADPHATAGHHLTPVAGDISVTCSCHRPAGQCAHAAALADLLGERILANPVTLITLRGGNQHHLLAAVRRAGHGRPQPPAATALPWPTQAAPDAFRTWRPTGASAAPPPLRTAPADTPLLEPPPSGPTAAELSLLIHAAADRAARLLAGNPPADSDPLLDAIRLLAHPSAKPVPADAAERLGLTALELRHLLLAHEYGGENNTAATHYAYTADPDDLAEARTAIQPLRPSPLSTLTGADNRITDPAARVELRFLAGRWYPYSERHGTWWPAPGHSTDPAAAYLAARRAQRG